MKQMVKFLGLLGLWALMGCRTVGTVSENREATRVEYRDRLRTDSVFMYLHDSVYIRERGDTVFVDKFKTQILYRDRLRVDTLSVIDTVRIETRETVVKETNRLTGWQWFQVWTGRIAACLIAAYLLFKRLLK